MAVASLSGFRAPVSAFERPPRGIIIHVLTVPEILDEEIAKKLA